MKTILLLAWLALSGACKSQLAPPDAARPGEARVFPSKVNGTLRVVDEGQLRVLYFSSDTPQTLVDRREPTRLVSDYTQAMLLAFALREADPRALGALRVHMVGLGGGALPRFLRRHYPGMRLETVELDPAVVKIAKHFFHVTEDENHRIHVGDGRAFLERSAVRYDILLLDAFAGGSDDVPRALTSLEFLRTVAARLAPGGLVAANFIFVGERRFAEVVKTYEAAFRFVARFHLHGRATGNVIVVAGNDEAHRRALEELPARAQRLQAHLGGAMDLAGWARTLDRRPLAFPGATVIRD